MAACDGALVGKMTWQDVDMRVTYVSSLYASTSISGENLALAAQYEALRLAGVDVDLVSRSTDEMSIRAGYRLASGLRVATGLDLGDNSLPSCEGPHHILHLHNLFPNFGRKWVLRWRGPVVATLHNYRSWCANGLLFRDGQVCVLCPSGSTVHSMRYACYRSSRIQTLPLAIATYKPERFDPVLRRADAIVTQTERMRDFLTARGIEEGRVHFVPGLVTTPFNHRPSTTPSGWVFVGRLTAEKGLRELLEMWPHSEPLEIMGQGPEERSIAATVGENVRFLGGLQQQEVLERLPAYEGLVFSGRCWEGAHPMVVREAMAMGVPVVAARGSSAGDLVERHGGGSTFSLDDAGSLQDALTDVRRGGRQLRCEAQRVADGQFGRTNWVDSMLTLYREVRKSFGRQKPLET